MGLLRLATGRLPYWGIAAALVALGALPLASWIPDGMSDTAYARRWVEWAYGTAICAGIGIVAAIVFGGAASEGARRMAAARRDSVAAVLRRHPLMADAVIAGACFAVYAAVAWSVFSARPLLIDELVQVLQARMYASGNLFVPTDASPAFFSVLHMVDVGERFYSQFPPGWPVMLALGSLAHAEWIVGPLCGAVAVFGFARVVRNVHGDDAPLTIAGGTLLFGLGSFAAFQFSSHMSHGPVLMWLVLATLALSKVVSDSPVTHRSRWRWALAAGLAAGAAFAVRPLDAVGFAVPAGAWVLWRARSDSEARRAVGWMTIGLLIPVALVMWVNIRTTGSPTTFGYEVLWGSSHGLGFHAAPWGDAHTPQRGIELLSLYATRLNTYLFETPFPSLLPVVAALLIATRLTPIERFLLCATGVHAVLYFAYWHDGFYLGPRFVTPWIPILVLLSLRAVVRLAARDVSTRLRVGMTGALLGAGVVTVAVDLPVRVAQYRSGLTSMREDYSAEATRAGVTNAVVFVRESWGAQLVARLWALGVSRSATAALYRNVDSCVLEHATTAIERERVRGVDIEERLRPLLADSLRVRATNVSPDTTERMLPGTVYDSTCSLRVAQDRDGYALFPPFLLDRNSGNVYARDLHEQNVELIARYPDRRAFIVRRSGVDGSAPLVWIPLRR